LKYKEFFEIYIFSSLAVVDTRMFVDVNKIDS